MRLWRGGRGCLAPGASLADARSQSNLRKRMKQVICSLTWSTGEKSQLILDGCSRVKRAWGALRHGVVDASAGLACTVTACFGV